MSMLTTEEIINLYLWGNKKAPTPEEIADAKYIRDEGARKKETVDAYDYMINGAGRYGTADRFKMFEKFFAGEGNFKPGKYSFDEFEDEIYNKKLAINQKTLGVQQYKVDIFSDDFVDRSYVFGSTSFRFDEDIISFVVHEDGTREIINLKIYPVEDNFDYESDDFIATVTNILSESTIDPSGIGRPVDLIFTDNAPIINQLTEEDFKVLQKSTSSSDYNPIITPPPSVPFPPFPNPVYWDTIIARFTAKYAKMWWNDKFTYVDSENRLVVFDGKDTNNNSNLSSPVGNAVSVALIAGNGDDQLSVVGAGHATKNYLEGGFGNDTYSVTGLPHETIMFDIEGNDIYKINGEGRYDSLDLKGNDKYFVEKGFAGEYEITDLIGIDEYEISGKGHVSINDMEGGDIYEFKNTDNSSVFVKDLAGKDTYQFKNSGSSIVKVTDNGGIDTYTFENSGNSVVTITDEEGGDSYEFKNLFGSTVNITDTDGIDTYKFDNTQGKVVISDSQGYDIYNHFIKSQDSSQDGEVTIKDEKGIDHHNIVDFNGKYTVRDLEGDDHYRFSYTNAALKNAVITIEDDQGEDTYSFVNFNGTLTIDDYGTDKDIYRFSGNSFNNANIDLSWSVNAHVDIFDEGEKNEYHINTTGGATYSITDKGRESVIYFGSNDEQITTSYEPKFWRTLDDNREVWVYQNKWAFKRIYSGYSENYQSIYDLQIMSLEDALKPDHAAKSDSVILLKDFKDGDFGIQLTDDLYLPPVDSQSYEEWIDDNVYDLYIDGDDANEVDVNGMITITFNLKDFLPTVEDLKKNPYKYRHMTVDDLIKIKDVNPKDYTLLLYSEVREGWNPLPIALGKYGSDTFEIDDNGNITLKLALKYWDNKGELYRSNGAQGGFSLDLALFENPKEEDEETEEEPVIVPLKGIHTFVYKSDETQTDDADFIWLGEKPIKKDDGTIVMVEDSAGKVEAGMYDYVLGSTKADEFSLEVVNMHRADNVSLEEYKYSLGYRSNENGEGVYQADVTFVGGGGADVYKVEKGQFIKIIPSHTSISNLQDTIIFGSGLSRKDFRIVKGSGSQIMMKFLNSRTLVTIDEFYFKGVKNIVIEGRSYTIDELGAIDLQYYEGRQETDLIKGEQYKLLKGVLGMLLHSSHIKRGIYNGNPEYATGWKITDIRLMNGEKLPESITYDPIQDALLYDAMQPLQRSIGLVFTITDKYGITSYIDRFFDLNFKIVDNTAPYALEESLKDYQVTNNEEFTWQLPSKTFIDNESDHGDRLSYSLKMKDGSRVPRGLSINKYTGEITGKLPDNITSYEVIIVATDKGGLSGEIELSITTKPPLVENSVFARNMNYMNNDPAQVAPKLVADHALLDTQISYRAKAPEKNVGDLTAEGIIHRSKGSESVADTSLQDTLLMYQKGSDTPIINPTVSQELHSLISAMAAFDSASNERDLMVADDSLLTQPLLTSSY